MNNPIYFTKIEYSEYLGFCLFPRSRILLNLVEKELSYQEFKEKRNMPVIQGVEIDTFWSEEESIDTCSAAMMIANDKTDFKYKTIKMDNWEQEVTFSYGIKLTDEQMKKLMPLCNACEFEPFRDRKMSMDDEGYIGYRDEVRMKFKAVTDSHIPYLELPMDYYYDEEHIWPSEKLYRCLIKTFFENNKKLRGHGLSYGGFSLFF